MGKRLAIAVLIMLAGCVQSPAPNWKAMTDEANAVQDRCWARLELGRLHNFSEAIDCATPQIIEIHRRYGYPHMDLLEMFRSRWRAIAERYDYKEISDAEYRAQFAELKARANSDWLSRERGAAASSQSRMMQPIVCSPTGFSVVCY